MKKVAQGPSGKIYRAGLDKINEGRVRDTRWRSRCRFL